jgi:tetratricopeptide (TPR) repeat protein
MRLWLTNSKNVFPINWRQYVEDWLFCERYYFVLLWQNSFDRAQQFAARMVERLTARGLPTWLWLEREGDAAFHARSYQEAEKFYQTSMNEKKDNVGALLKLSDLYFIFGDLEKEQLYREKVYGTLRKQ